MDKNKGGYGPRVGRGDGWGGGWGEMETTVLEEQLKKVKKKNADLFTYGGKLLK